MLVPTMQGVQLPVPASAFSAALAAVCLATALAPHQIDRTAVRRLGTRNAALALLVLAPSLPALVNPTTATGARATVGLVAFVLITTAFIRSVYVSIGIVAYLQVACTIRVPHAENSREADFWAGIIDSTPHADLWLLAVCALIVGLALQRLSDRWGVVQA